MVYSLLLAFALGASAPGNATTDSLRPDTDVRQVALHHVAEIQQCYQARGLPMNPLLSGTIEVELTVSPTGRVDSAAVSASDLRGAGKREVEECVTTMVRNWRFDRGPYGTETIVYPFNLVPDDAPLVTGGRRLS